MLLEPGRSIVGHAGALVARVVDTKRYPDGRQFAVLDAGMGELIRPALYGSYHRIVPVRPRTGADSSWDIVGPICESSDVFARDRQMPPLDVEDLVAILDAGAYGSVMASNYNRHLLPRGSARRRGHVDRHPPAPDAGRRAGARIMSAGRGC